MNCVGKYFSFRFEWNLWTYQSSRDLFNPIPMEKHDEKKDPCSSAMQHCSFVLGDRSSSSLWDTWQKKNGVLRIWTVGKQKLRIEFQGTYEYQSQAGPMANTGYAKGTADIKGNTAIFKPENSEAECKIAIVFSNKKLIVKQESNCGFGQNVSSSGTYSRINSQKPEFSDL
jgi:hypothetical protein